jgi:hypothetical protein
MEEDRILAEDEARTLRHLAAINEVFLVAACLRAFDCSSGELRTAHRIADLEDSDRLKKLIGKYVKRGNGYVRVLEHGEGSAFRELPEGVTADEVVDDVDLSEATPLQDRLQKIDRTLREATPPDIRLDELADAVEAILETCGPGNEQGCYDQIREWANTEVLSGDGPGDPQDMIDRGHRFFDRVETYAKDLQSQFHADGSTIGAMLAIRALVLARAELAEDSDDEMDALIESIIYLAADGSAPIGDVAWGLAARMVRRGQGEAVRRGAESLGAEGRALVVAALDGDSLTYYHSLYPSAAYNLGVMRVGQAAASATEDLTERKRFARLAVNAEERAVRVSTALGFALQNLDGSGLAHHVLWLRRVREEDGEDAARFKAVDLIENLLFYPRALLPVLMSEADPSDGNEQR